MTNWEEREFQIFLPFIDLEKQFVEQFWSDGYNAHRNAEDYQYTKRISSPVRADNPKYYLEGKMAPGGGFVGIFKPEEN
jgi:hypothetical protein